MAVILQRATSQRNNPVPGIARVLSSPKLARVNVMRDQKGEVRGLLTVPLLVSPLLLVSLVMWLPTTLWWHLVHVSDSGGRALC